MNFHRELVSRMYDEADRCHKDGCHEVAELLEEGAAALDGEQFRAAITGGKQKELTL